MYTEASLPYYSAQSPNMDVTDQVSAKLCVCGYNDWTLLFMLCHLEC